MSQGKLCNKEFFPAPNIPFSHILGYLQARNRLLGENHKQPLTRQRAVTCSVSGEQDSTHSRLGQRWERLPRDSHDLQSRRRPHLGHLLGSHHLPAHASFSRLSSKQQAHPPPIIHAPCSPTSCQPCSVCAFAPSLHILPSLLPISTTPLLSCQSGVPCHCLAECLMAVTAQERSDRGQ